jgi:ABC-type uncharacterized transport system substrate-binding protein
VKRRAFITFVAGGAIWSLAARAQQPAMPVIGFLHPSSPEPYRLRAFRHGLKDAGFVEGENVTIEYRWAENQIDRLPALAAELVQRRVAAIATAGPPAVFAAKTATTTIPVVFLVGEDPVKLGLVTSLARPGGNLTGINFFAVEVAAKRLELLRELVPGATLIGVLVNPGNVSVVETVSRDILQAARTIGLQIKILNAGTVGEVDAAFATLASERPDALFVANDPFFIDRRVQLAQLAARHALPAIGQDRLYAEVGGLISYGANLGDAYRQVGTYAGRILKGAKPADLPVQSTKFELVINVSTARMLGLAIPQTLLVTADEVIE